MQHETWRRAGAVVAHSPAVLVPAVVVQVSGDRTMSDDQVLNEMRPKHMAAFWRRVDRGGPNECWRWLGSKTGPGYGTFYRDHKRNFNAHRFSYELVHGPIPEGLHIDHLCRNPWCVNPAHLEPVTPWENTMRSPIAPSAVNARKTHCHRGHPLMGSNLRFNCRGDRVCRTCANARLRKWQKRQVAK